MGMSWHVLELFLTYAHGGQVNSFASSVKFAKTGYYSFCRKKFSERDEFWGVYLSMFNKLTEHACMVMSQMISLLARNPIIGLLFILAKNVLGTGRILGSVLKHV